MVIRHVEMKISTETQKSEQKIAPKLILDDPEKSDFSSFFADFFTSKRLRVVKNHFQVSTHVEGLVSEILSENQGISQ